MHLQMEELKARNRQRRAAAAASHPPSRAQLQRPQEGDIDHALAYSMQVSEVEDYAQRREQMQVEMITRYSAEEAAFDAKWKRGWRRFCCGRPPKANQDPYLDSDPIWGDYPKKEGVTPSKRDKLAWNLCPCVVVGCGHTGRRLWKRYMFSFSMLFGVAQVMMFLFVTMLSGGFVPISENVMIGPHFSTQNEVGAKNTAKIVYRDEWWRLFTPMMLHAGVIHLATNLSVQFRSSVALEIMWGHWIWLFIYVGSGIYATVASCVLSPNTLGVGSSGALCGLIGAWFMFILITWYQTLPSHETMRNAETLSLLFAILLIVGLSFLPLLDFPAHVGGLVMGGVLAMNVFAGRLQHPTWRMATRALGALLLLGIVVPSMYWLLYRTEPHEFLLHLCHGDDCEVEYSPWEVPTTTTLLPTSTTTTTIAPR
jgi:rhomboid protease GluP